jgi:hypothetical protein
MTIFDQRKRRGIANSSPLLSIPNHLALFKCSVSQRTLGDLLADNAVLIASQVPSAMLIYDPPIECGQQRLIE